MTVRQRGPRGGGRAPGSRSLVPMSGRRALPQIYLASTRDSVPSIFVSEFGGGRAGSKLKWLVSTCVAAVVAVVAIGMLLLGAVGNRDGETSLLARIDDATRTVFDQQPELKGGKAGGTSQKGDRLALVDSGLVTRHFVRDSVRQQRGASEFIAVKPYVRLVARLSTAAPVNESEIPDFDPQKLYANSSPLGEPGGGSVADNVTIKVQEIIGDVLPEDDGQQLTIEEVQQIVGRLTAELAAADGGAAEGAEPPVEHSVELPELTEIAAASSDADEGAAPANSVVLVKNVFDDGQGGTVAGEEVEVLKAGRGDTLGRLLKKNSVEAWQVRAIVEAAKTLLDTDILQEGQEVRLRMLPSPTRAGVREPAQVSVFSEGHGHLLTVARGPTGDYVASETPVASDLQIALDQQQHPQRTSLYASFYDIALSQGLPAAMIDKVLRTFAYDTDFKRRVGPGDSFEAFFDLEGDDEIAGKPRELLMMALAVGGESRKFYRFRTPDGTVDYYDKDGNNAKRFLNRKPVRGNDVRYTSGFGPRIHPLLKQRKMHTGVDWSAAPGTAILAAGNGVVEEAGRKGGNGNYIRIRHANGYQTAYSHLSRYAPGLQVGLKVSQGQTIGFVGSTGLSSGPHLHFEVLVNNSYVDPMRIHVPRERQLTGRLLGDFQKERGRVDELMGRSPVTVATTTADHG